MTKRFDYETVYEYIKAKIKNDLSSNRKIPSENELCALFNLTRATVRQGINKLKNEGLIFSKQGSGYFVAHDKINYTLSHNTIFSNEMIKLGKTPNIRILNLEKNISEDFILKKFDAIKKQTILKITLIRMVDTIPILIGHSYLNLKLTPDIEQKIITTTSFTKLFKEYGLEPIRNHSELEIIPCGETFKQLLEMQNTLPLIKIASTSSDQKSGEIIEYVESFFRSDLVKISIDFNHSKEVTAFNNRQ